MVHTNRGFGGSGKARNTKVLDNGVKVEVPTQEQVRLWVKQDLAASSYFLGMLLRYPDLVDRIADELFKRVQSDEHGALIDRIKEKEHGIAK